MQHVLQILSFQVRQIISRIFIYCIFPSSTKHRVSLCFIIVKLSALAKARIWLCFTPGTRRRTTRRNTPKSVRREKRKKLKICAHRLSWCLTLMIKSYCSYFYSPLMSLTYCMFRTVLELCVTILLMVVIFLFWIPSLGEGDTIHCLVHAHFWYECSGEISYKRYYYIYYIHRAS